MPAHELVRIVWVGTGGDGGFAMAKSRADVFVASPGEVEQILAAIVEVMEGTSVSGMLDVGPVSEESGRILVVEDDQAIQFLLVTYLSSQGFSVFTANNGEDAVRVASRGKVDAILMDIQLPGLDGYEATKRIRALGGPLATVPILGQTALTGPIVQKRCREVGMTGVIEKPPDMPELCRTLRTVIVEARRTALYSKMMRQPTTESVLAADINMDASRNLLESMVKSLGSSQTRIVMEDRAIKLRLKAHLFVELVLAWEIANISRVHNELTEIATSIGAQALVALLVDIMRVIRAGNRTLAEKAVLEIEEHANKLGSALMLYVDSVGRE